MMNLSLLERQRLLGQESRLQNELAPRKSKAHSRHGMRRLLQTQYALIVERLDPTGDILEIGCGVGDFLEYVHTHCAGNRALGIDVSDRCVEMANDRRLDRSDGGRLLAVVGSGENLCSAVEQSRAFDKFGNVVMRSVIHHLQDPAVVFRQAIKVLTPNGRMIIIEGNIASPYRRLMLGLADRLGIQHEASMHPHTPPREIANLLASVGFSRIRIDYLPGVFAPLAYLGKGGPVFWDLAAVVDNMAKRVSPLFFGWWYLLSAEKGSR